MRAWYALDGGSNMKKAVERLEAELKRLNTQPAPSPKELNCKGKHVVVPKQESGVVSTHPTGHGADSQGTSGVLPDTEFYKWIATYKEPHPMPKIIAKAAWFAALQSYGDEVRQLSDAQVKNALIVAGYNHHDGHFVVLTAELNANLISNAEKHRAMLNRAGEGQARSGAKSSIPAGAMPMKSISLNLLKLDSIADFQRLVSKWNHRDHDQDFFCERCEAEKFLASLEAFVEERELEKELTVAAHIRQAAPDGCQCEPCISTRVVMDAALREERERCSTALLEEIKKGKKEGDRAYKSGDLFRNKYWQGFNDALAFAQSQFRSTTADPVGGETEV
jgi:hypothetical protein